jgi:alkanesulfonate monooxygenase SsuD/methylene tetrahydromethanopterin reductase-like flavin-dependent oxidoreductase (luciferase family)
MLSEEEDQGFWDAFTVLSAIAALTQRITIGSLVACASFRTPGLVAKIADTLDEVSQGRFVLGLGSGWYPA